MTNRVFLILLIISVAILSCSKDSANKETTNSVAREAYFPPIGTDDWETISPTELDWNEEAIQPLLDYLDAKGTKSFLVLKNGRIVIESYFNESDALENNAWNSTAKTLTAMCIGIAQEEGFLSINDSSADYLGTGWSSLTLEQEDSITIRNHMTMTTGLDYNVENNFCTDVECFTYLNEPEADWYYHQGAYTVLNNILTAAVGQSSTLYFNQKIKDKIGMQGAFVTVGFNKIYFSTARSMARFGILNLNKGIWDGTAILQNSNYFNAMTSSSQNLNPAYGYLYWLNGKDAYRVPSSESAFSGKLIPNAPNDLYAGLGANDQKLYVVPSEQLVVIRMGADASQGNLGPSSFDNELWGLLNDVLSN